MVAGRSVLAAFAALPRLAVGGPPEIREDHLTALHKLVDIDGSGTVCVNELKQFARVTGRAVREKTMTPEDLMQGVDEDDDGAVSLEEHLELLDDEEKKHGELFERAKFEAADTNRDGKLDHDELPAMFYPDHNPAVLKVTIEDSMTQMDTNNDKKVTLHEFVKYMKFQRESGEEGTVDEEDAKAVDMNSNGFIDEEEMRDWVTGDFHHHLAFRTMVKHADENSDDHITVQELVDAWPLLESSAAHAHFIEWGDHHGILKV